MTTSTHAPAGDDTLHSELAQLCLPSSQRERNQAVAWVNSLCLLYLLIGLVGLKPPQPLIRDLAPIEEPIITVLEQLPPPTTPPEQSPDQTPPDPDNAPSDAPSLVAVTLETPSVVFSVPTVGNVLVSAGVAQAPPLNPMAPAAAAPTNRIFDLRFTGRGGNHPLPDYPPWAMQDRLEGEMLVLIAVDPTGSISSVEVQKSTGNTRLDNHTLSHIRRRFTFPPADGPRTYRLPIAYNLQ